MEQRQRASPKHLIVPALLLAVGLAVQWRAYLNHDVAFLAWVAREVAGGAVYGRDILEANFPLAFLIYSPVAAFVPVAALPIAVKLWTMLLAALSLALLWRGLPEGQRAAVLIAFAAFLALALPREFAQREQIAFILVAPWCVAAERGRREGLLVGLLAGLGLAIKPHFLVPLALVVLYRRRFGVEEVGIAVAGGLYALSLPIFFWPFLSESLPLARSAYWAVDPAWSGVPRAFLLGALILVAAVGALRARDRLAIGFVVAAAGFFLAAFLQMKLFPYHLLPAWGFLLLAAAGLLKSGRLFAAALLTVAAGSLLLQALPWWRGSEGRERQIPALAAILERGPSFTVIAVHPYPSFPTALHTRACFAGWSNSHWFLPAVAKVASGEAERRDGVAEHWALRQAMTEVARRPARVVVGTDWRRHTGLKSPSFDGLAWLQRNPEFARLWSAYEEEARVGRFRVFRLRDGVASAGCRRAG